MNNYINPYLLSLPAVVSFSGGRTSGYMLRKVLDAFCGQPDGLVVSFQNTGLEHPATYDFVRDIEQRWEVKIIWLEYCVTDGEHDFKIVNFDSASRNGEPFTAIVDYRGYLPNPVARFCTADLKVRTLSRYIKSLPDFGFYTNAIGLRADEPRRVARLKSDNASRYDTCCPMHRAGATAEDVLRFWSDQPFDLNLPQKGNMAGNCTGCMLKSKRKLEILMYEMPDRFDWWVTTEKRMSERSPGDPRSSFRQDRPSYAAMMEGVRRQGRLPFDAAVDDNDTIPCMCHD